jgi:5-dehydro-4-deoxyglucarate dehydratase
LPQLDGLLFFPVTPFDANDRVDVDVLAEHLSRGLNHGPGGMFVACGTGEFHALGPAEHEQVVRTAVSVVGGRVPVIAGTGGSVSIAAEMARAAERAGADGLLLLPPYLVDAPPSGIVRYTKAIASVTDLPLIVYNRDNARFDPESAATVAALPTVVGFKDGRGDVDLMMRTMIAVESRLEGLDKAFQFFNGLPTAELSVAAYRALGVPLYSSAAFCFAPEISVAFHRAITSGDDQLAHSLISAFFSPFVDLRQKVIGGAVSLVKAGVRLRGLDVGGVRPPLVDPSPAHLEALEQITEAGLRVASGVLL